MALESANRNSTAPKSESDVLFYNVMPAGRTVGPLLNVSKSINTEASVTNQPWYKKNMRWIIAISLGLVVIGVGGYFGYQYFSKGGDTIEVFTPLKHLTPEELEQKKATSTPEAPEIDQKAKDWQNKYFGNEICPDSNKCGDTADPDRDGLTNGEEYTLGTDPNNNDSDRDGISDGDEVHIFGSDPTRQRTANDPKFNDADYIRGGYNPTTVGTKYPEDKLNEIKQKIKTDGLHKPTFETLGENGRKFYGVEGNIPTPGPLPTVSTSPTSLLDSASDKLDRDTQRQSSIKKIASMLVKYKQDYGTFPETTDFTELLSKIKPYDIVATNFTDPINSGKFVYAYSIINGAKDFTLSYFSETQNQLIKFNASDANKIVTVESANINDNQRMRDLENLQSALLIYSTATVSKTQDYIFPAVNKYKAALMPEYLSTIPKDPKTDLDYEYRPGEKLDNFTLRVSLENPTPGTTGYMCNQEECHAY